MAKKLLSSCCDELSFTSRYCWQALSFSFQNILRIDNLNGLYSLVKLQLDNNIIEKIENIGHLTNLEWLDLSFNNIQNIQGLDTLVKLTDLRLFPIIATYAHVMDQCVIPFRSFASQPVMSESSGLDYIIA